MTHTSEHELSGFVNLIQPIRYSYQSKAVQDDLSLDYMLRVFMG